ncbi:hypothetical protein PENANT_c030G01884 [Penicillium antarcticum]|uniref:FAD-binding PCMH-type domain-containing protein n=1 Tax=Penicillium antarcticum TaxID=416450 RepID=A0A1V6PX42_9EURO|nr:hypothetical protein PENANT_c030G01884 [Penicillium antarcticum]
MPILGFLGVEPTALGANNEAHLADCLATKDVLTVFNTSAQWLELAKSFTFARLYNPVAITLPTTPQEVSESVSCAASVGIKVQARSGGHSYASYSTGGKNGSLIVDLRMFNEITVDNKTGVASVGGGVRLGNLDLSLYAQGKRALSHGTCPDVSIGGHFTHGGYGYVSRAWGLATDTIIALDVILADGSFIHATASSYPDIYFALRGAADSFGIVITFYLKTLAAPKKVVTFSVNMPAVLRSSAIAADGFLQLQEFSLNSPLMTRNLTLGIVIEGGKEFILKRCTLVCVSPRYAKRPAASHEPVKRRHHYQAHGAHAQPQPHPQRTGENTDDHPIAPTNSRGVSRPIHEARQRLASTYSLKFTTMSPSSLMMIH